ncbi:MAG: CHAT domain-containing protein [bacterium]
MKRTVIFLWVILNVCLSFLQSNTQTVQKPFKPTYLDALHLIGQQRYDEAIQRLKAIIADDSSFVRAYLKLVEVYKYQNNLKSASAFFEKVIASSPKNPYAHHALGLVYRENREYQQAYNKILRAIQLDFENYAAYPDFVSVHRDMEEAKQTIGDVSKAKPEVAAAHYGLAYIYDLQFQWARELEEAKQAVALQPDFLEARYLVSSAYYELGQYHDALNECNSGLSLAEKTGDCENQIDFIKLKAFITNKMGDPTTALKYLHDALKMTQEIGDKDKESDTLNNLTRIYWYSSNYRQALDAAKRAYAIEQRLGKKPGQASNLNYMGIMYAQLGDYSMALEYYEQAQDLYEEIGNRGSAGICYGNNAGVQLILGNEQKALTLLKDAISIAKEQGSGWRNVETNYTIVMGDVFKNLGQFDEALDQYNQALQIVEELKTEEHQVSNLLGKIGGIYQKLGAYPKALEFYQQALSINMRLFKEALKAENLLSIGSLYLDMKENANAELAYEKALNIARKLNQIELVWKAESGLARIFQNQGRRLEAVGKYKLAIESIESIRGKLRLEQEKAGYIKDKVAVYASLIGLLADLHQQHPDKGYDSEAFHYVERMKARTLLDIVYQGRIFHNLAEIPPDFMQRYLLNEKELEQKHLDLSIELAKEEQKENRELIRSLNNEIKKLQREKAQLLKEIRERYPKYYRLTNPRILTADQVQQEILTDGQVLLEYLVGEKSIFIWALTKKEMKFQTIALTRAELEDRLARISPLFLKEKAPADIRIDHRWANIRPNLLYELYKTLMQKPLAEILKPGTELIVVPDDILHYFPFEILVSNFNRQEVHYLVEKHAISYAASASLLSRELQIPGQKNQNLLAFGNPEFSRDQSEGILDWVNSLVPFKSVLRGGQFEPLPHAELEVKAIAENFQNPLILTGAEASEKAFKARAPNYGFLHLATHNISDDKQPMYSKIILAQTEQQSEDGYLQTYEVYNLRLHAELVVLSGCNTGLGKLSRGEGLIGMTRAFQYAGVPSLVVSLWPVNDESTAELMKYFYRNIKAGLPKNRALQKAKIELIHANDWRRDPFYWGAFVLIGDWREVVIK